MSPKAYFLVWVDGNKVCPIYRRWWKGRKRAAPKISKREKNLGGTNRQEEALFSFLMQSTRTKTYDDLLSEVLSDCSP